MVETKIGCKDILTPAKKYQKTNNTGTATSAICVWRLAFRHEAGVWIIMGLSYVVSRDVYIPPAGRYRDVVFHLLRSLKNKARSIPGQAIAVKHLIYRVFV